VLFTLPRAGLLQALDQPPGIGRDPEQMRRFLQGFAVRAGEEHGVPAAGGYLDRGPIVVDLLDERDRFFRASLAVIAIADLLRYSYQMLYQLRVRSAAQVHGVDSHCPPER
jgi:hypothetical protein